MHSIMGYREITICSPSTSLVLFLPFAPVSMLTAAWQLALPLRTSRESLFYISVGRGRR
jgi:hypothetical protein